MSAEEFNDDILIPLDDDIIEEIVPITQVREEVIKDDAILRLNKDQINAAITNLIIDRHRNSTSLRNKVTAYSKLFFNYPFDVDVEIKGLKPVILCDKLTYFVTEDDHAQNKEYEYAHFMKSEKLSNFLSQFHSINRDTSKQSSIQSANKLYALYAPFSNRESQDVRTLQYQAMTDQDAVRHCIFDEFDCDTDAKSRSETMRLIGTVKRNNIVYYDGDVVNVIGFFNQANDSVEFEEFDINEYIHQVKKFKEGEKVHVMFNTPTFDATLQKLKKYVKGTIKHASKKELVITLAETVYEDNKTNYNAISFTLVDILSNHVFLYSSQMNVDDCFCKQKLLMNNILFRLPQTETYTVEDIQSFIMPNSISELILMHEPHFLQYKNIRDIQHKVLKPVGIDVNNLPQNTHALLTYIFSQHKQPRKRRVHAIQPRAKIPYRNTTPLLDFDHHHTLFDFYNKQYIAHDTYIDDALNRFRYLKSNRDNGAYYVLSVLQRGLKKKYNKHIHSLAKYKQNLMKIEDELDKLDIPLISAKDAVNICTPKYSKEYKKLDELVADNGKHLYFDKKLDVTPYNVLQGVVGKSANEQKVHAMNELMTNTKYKHISKKDLEFEVESIVSGKRRVRLGDMCVLHTTYGDVVYVRKDVSGYEMWVKQFTTPFKVCTDNPLVDFNDLVKLETCVKQSFDDVCRTNKDARMMHRYQLLKNIQSTLKSILEVLENYDRINEILQQDITMFESLNMHTPETYVPTRIFEHEEHVDYEEYDGEMGNAENVEFQIDGNDLGNFVFVGNQLGNETNKQIDIENQETLNMLLSFIQVPLDTNEFSYILQNINALYPRSTIEQSLQQLEIAYWKKFNVNVMKPSKEVLQKLKDKLLQLKANKEVELISKYYFNILRTMIAYIIVIIFIRYPDYTIQVIIPSCVKLLSYVGYPVSEKTDAQRSLVSYFACLLTKISVSDDVRFALFYEKDAQEIQSSIKEAIDAILSHNVELKVQLEINKPKLSMYKHHEQQELAKDITELQGFKPNFKFGNIDRTNPKTKKVLSYIKAIQQIVADSKISKQSVLNVPNLFNACCAEVLRKDIDFFDYFESSTGYNSAKSKVADLPHQSFHDINLHPNIKKKEMFDLFSKYKIQQSSDVVASILTLPHDEYVDGYVSENVKKQLTDFVVDIRDPDIKTIVVECADNFERVSWWEDKFYPLMHTKWEDFVNTLSLYISDKMNIDITEYIKAVIIDVGSVVDDVKTTRNVLFNFMKAKMNSILGSIKNVKKLSKEITDETALRNDALFSIIVSVSNNKNYQSILQHLLEPMVVNKAIEHIYFRTDDEEVIVKNVSLLAYIFITSLQSLLKKTHASHDKLLISDQNVVVQDSLKISCMVVYHIFEKLAGALSNTLVDPSKLKKAVEELRERRKQELIASYKVDDEERQLQITLKNMGLENWADILVGDDNEQNEPIVQQSLYQKDEYDMAKDEIYETFKGEHNDNYEDDEDDEDVMVSYEAYDY